MWTISHLVRLEISALPWAATASNPVAFPTTTESPPTRAASAAMVSSRRAKTATVVVKSPVGTITAVMPKPASSKAGPFAMMPTTAAARAASSPQRIPYAGPVKVNVTWRRSALAIRALALRITTRMTGLAVAIPQKACLVPAVNVPVGMINVRRRWANSLIPTTCMRAMTRLAL